MDTKVVLKDIHESLDGEYPLGWEFKKRHWRILKKMADVTPLELVSELKRGNIDLSIALVAIALDQAGKPYLPEMLLDSEGVIEIVDVAEDDAGPPATPPEQPGSSGSSGEPTNGTGEHFQETTIPNGSGTPGSGTGAISGPVISATSPPGS